MHPGRRAVACRPEAVGRHRLGGLSAIGNYLHGSISRVSAVPTTTPENLPLPLVQRAVSGSRACPFHLVRVRREEKGDRPGGDQRSNDQPGKHASFEPRDTGDDFVEPGRQFPVDQARALELAKAERKDLEGHAFGQHQQRNGDQTTDLDPEMPQQRFCGGGALLRWRARHPRGHDQGQPSHQCIEQRAPFDSPAFLRNQADLTLQAR